MNKTVFPILAVFLCMGFGDAAGALVNLVTGSFRVSNTVASLIASAGFIMFGLLSVPMGVVQYRVGKKNVLILGLGVFFVGVMIPVFGLSFHWLLLAVFIMGGGAAILQVAGNPIMRDVSGEGKYSRNLSFGQFIKAIGSLSATVIPALAAGRLISGYFAFRPPGGTPRPTEWRILFPIYAAVILLTLGWILTLRVQEKQSPNQKPTTLHSSLRALGNRSIRLMVIGIFLYVGAEVSMSSKIAIFFSDRYGIDLTRIGMLGVGMFFLALTLGRFLGSVILNWVKPGHFLAITSVVSMAGIAGIFVDHLPLAWICVFMVGIGFANIFPLIFSITVDRFPGKTNEISGLMVTAIVGGAIVPLITGIVADIRMMLSFLVPLACIGYVLVISLRMLRQSPVAGGVGR